MMVRFVDNVNVKMADTLRELLPCSRRVQIAVAFARYSGLRLIEPAIDRCLQGGGEIEFVVGLDFRTRDAEALRALRAREEAGSRLRLYCYSEPGEGGGTYHPKLYLFEKETALTGIIGSSNLTEGGLRSNVEANVALDFDTEAEEANALRGIYSRLKHQPTRFAPDNDYISAYEEAVRRATAQAQRAEPDDRLRQAVLSVRHRERILPTPLAPGCVLGGWQKLVYAKLPPGEFRSSDLYQYAAEFHEFYPDNSNIEAKIRQVLQRLRDVGLVRYLGGARWENPLAGQPVTSGGSSPGGVT